MSPRLNNAYLYLLTAAAMSLGWRIRGQFGHEIGAAMAGALGGLAIVMSAGREDWRRRAVAFAALGALGWSFGGSMSYMKVVGYCHSSDPATVAYAFACMTAIGFLWGAPGGAAVALAAVLDARRLTAVLAAMAAVFAAWCLQDIVVDVLESRAIKTDWFGSDWIGASAAMIAALLLAAVRRRVDTGVSLVLYLSLGWWMAFGGLVVLAGLHMNPPRGDNWAGCLGIAGGLFAWCVRHGQRDVLRASLVTGFLGGIGFAAAQLLKLAILRAEWTDNPHVVMEWTHGALFGIALVAAMSPLIRYVPELSDEPVAPAAQTFALFWLLWILPYYNFRKCAEQWGKQMPALKEPFQGLPVTGELVPSAGGIGWIEIVFLGWAVALAALLLRQRRAPSPLVPADSQGRAQLLFVVLVWMFAVASFARDLTNFHSGNELRIQVAITLHAILCTVLALWPRTPQWVAPGGAPPQGSLKRVVAGGVVACLLAAAACFAGKEAMFRETFAPGFYMDHIRFGPNNTNDTK